MKRASVIGLPRPIKIINVGILEFAESVKTQDVPVVHVDWRPPAEGDEEILALLDNLL